MKVLVTGGSGFLGSWVCQLLSERGDSVRALVRKSSNRKFLETLKNVELPEGGVDDAGAVEEAAKGCAAIVHCAGLVKARNEDELRATNVEGTRNIVNAAKKAKARLVHVSSLEAAGPSQDGRPVPDDQERPITAYGRSKLDAEKLVLAAKDEIHGVILRPGAIYGPRDQEILEAFKTVSRGLAANVAGGRALGSFIYASDCAEACVIAIDAKVPSGSVYFVEDGAGAIDQKQVMEDIAKALDKKFVLKPSLPAGALRVVARGVQAWGKLRDKPVMLTPEKANMLLHHFVCSAERTRKDLGWAAKVPWSEGVGRTARWYRENGWL